MNIQGYEEKVMILFALAAIICVWLGACTIMKENEADQSSVEKTMMDTANNIRTVENSSGKIQTNIGQKKLIVYSYYGVNDSSMRDPRFPLKKLGKPVKEVWKSVKPKEEYKIGVLYPHIEDSYWISANYGIINYAKELGVKIKLFTAGGYIKLGDQKEQLHVLAENHEVDGIILASLDYWKIDTDIEDIVNSGMPVVELINNINASKINAKSLISFYEMGYKAGEFVIKDSVGKNIKIAFFPGPKGSGWAPDTFYGFCDAIAKLKKENQKIEISEPYYGDTRPKVQLLRVVSVLQKNNDYDYIVGCAPAVIEAEKFIAKDKVKYQGIKIISTYITGEVYDLILKGSVLAAPSDQTIAQCRIALDMMVRILNGEEPGKDFPFRTGPEIPVISKKNISQYKYEELFGTKDYIPVVNKINE